MGSLQFAARGSGPRQKSPVVADESALGPVDPQTPETPERMRYFKPDAGHFPYRHPINHRPDVIVLAFHAARPYPCSAVVSPSSADLESHAQNSA